MPRLQCPAIPDPQVLILTGHPARRNLCAGGVARDFEKDHPAVMEMLTAFIREHSREPWPLPKHDTEPAPPKEIRPDVQAAVTVIGR